MWWYKRIGTSTAPGPCTTHVGVGMGVGVGVGDSGWSVGADMNSKGGCGVGIGSNLITGVGVITVCESISCEQAEVRKMIFQVIEQDVSFYLFNSHIKRSPSSVSQGAMTLMTLVSLATTSANPPVATTFISFPSSVRKRATMPSTMLT